MSGYTRTTALFAEMLLMFGAVGCGCPLFRKPAVETPAPVVEAPPPAPQYVERPPALPPPVLPPAVTKSIEELSDKYPGLFKFDKDKSLLNFNSDVMFDSGSVIVKPETQTVLGKLATILNEEGARDRKLTIIGHTDSDRVVKAATIGTLKKLGKSADNMGLSEARSEAVAAVLQAGDIDASRMITKGRGDAEPVADNRTSGNKARNRRVEIYVTPAKPAM